MWLNMQINNVSQTNSFPCSGCGACVAVCPRGAVQLSLDDAGFYRAAVREDLCVDCGLCLKVCHRFRESGGGVSLYDAKLYALQSADAAAVQKSSSGGIAQELTLSALEQGAGVIGTVYNLDTDRAEHWIASDMVQAEAFAGSKYLQSDASGAFREALQNAKSNPALHYVATGTPCQIAGMARAAEQLRVREQFLLVEIFCHGVPSYKLWEAECEKFRKKLKTDRFDNVQFRYKKDDWHSYCLRLDAGEKTVYAARETTLFWQVFFENILLGDACYRCEARKDRSLADIRLGDYWGSRFRHRSDGVSAVFACTPQGEAAVKRLLEENRVVQLAASDPAEMLAAQNMAGYSQQQLHGEAMAVLRTQGIHQAVAYYRRRQTPKQKCKRTLLRLSAVIPAPLRAKLRKANSSRQLRKS